MPSRANSSVTYADGVGCLNFRRAVRRCGSRELADDRIPGGLRVGALDLVASLLEIGDHGSRVERLAVVKLDPGLDGDVDIRRITGVLEVAQPRERLGCVRLILVADDGVVELLDERVVAERRALRVEILEVPASATFRVPPFFAPAMCSTAAALGLAWAMSADARNAPAPAAETPAQRRGGALAGASAASSHRRDPDWTESCRPLIPAEQRLRVPA